jgi:hypothetical protein
MVGTREVHRRLAASADSLLSVPFSIDPIRGLCGPCIIDETTDRTSDVAREDKGSKYESPSKGQRQKLAKNPERIQNRIKGFHHELLDEWLPLGGTMEGVDRAQKGCECVVGSNVVTVNAKQLSVPFGTGVLDEQRSLT